MHKFISFSWLRIARGGALLLLLNACGGNGTALQMGERVSTLTVAKWDDAEEQLTHDQKVFQTMHKLLTLLRKSGTRGGKKNAILLLKRSLEQNDTFLRIAAASYLAEEECKEAVPLLIKALKEVKSERGRRAAAQSLKKILDKTGGDCNLPFNRRCAEKAVEEYKKEEIVNLFLRDMPSINMLQEETMKAIGIVKKK